MEGEVTALPDLLAKSELNFQRLNIGIVDCLCLVTHANSSLKQKILMHLCMSTCCNVSYFILSEFTHCLHRSVGMGVHLASHHEPGA